MSTVISDAALARRVKANALRALAMDAVEQAKSGHPGMPMGMADIAEVLWSEYLHHNPADPAWPDRDRFILSNGHGSMLLYGLLHLTGYALPMAEIKRFRQLHSMTPGHPEHGDTPGVETTTGPLGQGISNAVGMALAEKMLAARFNRPGHTIVDHHTYVFLGDGCLMEGISHEACSLAGTLKLGKLIALWDDNGISIDGEVAGWFTDDTPQRFAAYGWQVVAGVDGHDPEAVRTAIDAARAEPNRPTLICCKTVIGFGAPTKQGTAAAHGAVLGADEIARARERLGWSYPPFEIPDAIYQQWDARAAGADRQAQWNARLAAYRTAYPDLAAEFERRIAGELPVDWTAGVEAFIAATERQGDKVATRKASQLAFEALGPMVPELVGGSADLTGSNLTRWSGSKTITGDDAGGNYLHFGVREFGMTAIASGLALHGGFIPYCGTFLTFSDYARNAVRMAALMKIRNVLVYSHDSIGLGEDGPTHQSVEHAASLRLIPNLSLWRPCDATEAAVAWRAAVERTAGPTCLLLSRQGLPHMARDTGQVAAIACGGYVLRDCDGVPEAIIMATGSEVALAVAAAATLTEAGRRVRVVSLPSTDVFDAQGAAYREQVLPAAVTARVAVEAGVTAGWYRYVGSHGGVVGLDRFGESAPAGDVFDYFGFTPARVVEAVQAALEISPVR